MKRAWKVILLLAVFLLLVLGMAQAWGAQKDGGTPVFTPKDRQEIGEYYRHLLGTLAPGSLDRSPFPLAIEQALARGSRVPMQLEKDLEPLPAKLESALSEITGEYARYKLGPHVLLVRKTDLAIADIIKKAGSK